jgi:hypothetical protein
MIDDVSSGGLNRWDMAATWCGWHKPKPSRNIGALTNADRFPGGDDAR